MNRAERRRIVHELRQIGCRCTPSVTPIDPANVPRWATGLRGGADVMHELDCPLGQRVAALQAVGRVSIVGPSRQGCAR